MSLNTFTYLREHSLFALFYLDKKKEGVGGGSSINGEEEHGSEVGGGFSGMGNNRLSWWCAESKIWLNLADLAEAEM